ncbi:hypothetical protein OHU45_28285 [Streptomyces tubercidicus]|nr:hypothetical protein OG761_27995 [Streptomyces tubercidicus]WSX20000.1 hypothetical protein OG690_09375 [Streptomyces tubercidicus]
MASPFPDPCPAQREQLAGLLRIPLQDTQRKLGDDRISQVGDV